MEMGGREEQTVRGGVRVCMFEQAQIYILYDKLKELIKVLDF